MKSKSEIAFALGIAYSVIVLMLFWVGAFEFLELKSLDLRFRYFSKQEQASNDVVLVTIDEKQSQKT